jgi:hypothetical protein
MSSTAFKLHIAPHCTPIVDKITITVPFPNKVLLTSILHGGTCDHDSDFATAIYTAINDTSVFNNGKYGRYKLSKEITLASTEHRVNAQFLPKEQNNTAFARFEFNPWKIGEAGLMEFASICGLLFYDGYEFVQEHGKVTRVDAAIDLHGVSMEQIQLTQGQKATSQKYSSEGNTQTIYSGSSKGQQFKAYDKIAQLKIKSGETVTRIEHKLLPQLPLHKLHTLTNPFKHVQICKLPPHPPLGIEKYLWKLIRDSIKQRGSVAALNSLPPDLRHKARETLKFNSKTWWDSDTIWKKWAAAVQPVQSGGMNVPAGACSLPPPSPNACLDLTGYHADQY